MQTFGDRFISHRGHDEDVTALFGTKIELFSQPATSPVKEKPDSEMRDESNPQQQQNQTNDSEQSQEENKKTYRALLQNQVLGIDNAFLLHEIHNSEDYMLKQNLYTQMQQTAETMEGVSGNMGSPDQSNYAGVAGQVSPFKTNEGLVQCKNTPGGGPAEHQEASPFNSKFTVLKFTNSSVNTNSAQKVKTPNKLPFEISPEACHKSCNTGNGIARSSTLKKSSENRPKPQICKTLFPAESNFSIADSISSLRVSKPISENLNPMTQEVQKCANSLFSDPFARRPIGGFEEEQIIVPKTKQRSIPKIPYKVLDAPALQDDYYLNLVDWSELNDLVVGLSSCIYIWSATSSKVTKLYDLGQSDSVTSVGWARRGTHLSVGTDSGLVQVWDVTKQKLVRVFQGHQGRVGALAWSSTMLSSGSKDKSILNRDLRCKDDFISSYTGHKQEVCGLKWSFDDQQLASGGNDNKLFVWNAGTKSTSEPMWRFTSHKAAVKALAWSPHQKGLLASGGGTADRCIRFWNTIHGQEVSCMQTDSQVCNLMFSKNENEIVSTHGYSENAVCVWKYPSMRKLATLTGHNLRVLYLAMSPDGESIVTGAGDETLRFWKVFPKTVKAKKQKSLIENSAFVIR